MLKAKNLTYYQSERTLFSNLNFSLEMGKGLLVSGPNGIGKSTLLRIIVGLLLPHSGEVTWQEQVISRLCEINRAQIAYLGHKNGIKLSLTVLENLQYAEILAGLSASKSFHQNEILEQFALQNSQHLIAEKLSAGQKQRLALAMLKMTAAKLWILDEPLTALDTSGIQLFQEQLGTHLDQGGMAVIASHQALHLNDLTVLNLVL